MKIKVIIPASGSGVRFGGKIPKQFLKIDGKEVIVHTIEKFNGVKSIDEIIIAAKPEYFVKLSILIRKYKLTKVKKIVEGGKRRQDSVYNALMNSECKKNDLILTHDAVRPYISRNKICEIIKSSIKNGSVIPGMPVSETVKRTNKQYFVEETISREKLFLIQTPQAFRYDILKKSFEKAIKENFIGTDEAAIVENAGYKVKVIEGENANIKITVKADLR